MILLTSVALLVSFLWAIKSQSAPDKLVYDAQRTPDESAIPAVPSDTETAPIVVVLDAGHGGHDPGADGASGNYEKHFTQALTEKVYRILLREPGFKPYMTRTDDTFIELEDRAAIANSQQADAFLSIHGNTFTSDPSVSGTETYYYEPDSAKLAQVLQQAIVKATGFSDRGIKKEDWKVLRHSEVPAVLLEVGFLTNVREEALLLGETGQSQVAQAIVDGLKSYFQIK